MYKFNNFHECAHIVCERKIRKSIKCFILKVTIIKIFNIYSIRLKNDEVQYFICHADDVNFIRPEKMFIALIKNQVSINRLNCQKWFHESFCFLYILESFIYLLCTSKISGDSDVLTADMLGDDKFYNVFIYFNILYKCHRRIDMYEHFKEKTIFLF